MKVFDFKDQFEEVIISWYGGDPMIAINELKDKIALKYTCFITKTTEKISSNCVCYQILKNGSKTIHQYWLVDGA
jgi:sulfatase maturation enzyme AslB (radical SAM superfamily)